MAQEEHRPFCLNEAINSGFARFGRALGRVANLCRSPAHPSSEAAAEQQANDFRVGSVHTIPENETTGAANNGSKEDVEQGLSHASSSSVS